MNMFEPFLSKDTEKYISNVLKSSFIGEGEVVENFENMLSKKLGLKNPVALNSGTSALHLSLILSNVSIGDEVIIPAQTFIATGLAVLMAGAKPVFADIDLNTGNINPESVNEKLNKKTKAVIAVHWGGNPCDLKELNKICKK